MPARVLARARVVPPSAAAAGRGSSEVEAAAPLDFEGELRRAARLAAERAEPPAQLDGDSLETLACVACEFLNDGGAGARREAEDGLRTAVEPLLEEAGLDEAARGAVVDALLAAAAGGEAAPADGAGDAAGPAAGAVDLPGPPPRRLPPEPRWAAVWAGAAGTAPSSEEAPTRTPPLRWVSRGAAKRLKAAEYLRERAQLVAKEREAEAERERELAAYYDRGSDPAGEEVGARRVHRQVASARAGGAGGAAAGGLGSGSSSEEEEEEEDEATRADRRATQQRLRELGEPATLFGEGDGMRLERLRRCELCRDQDVLATGSTNVMQILDRRVERSGAGVALDFHEDDDFLARPADGAATPRADLVPALTASPDEPAAAEEDEDEVEAFAGEADGEAPEADDEGDEETKVVVAWLRVTIREWQQTLEARSKAEHGSADFKVEKAHFRQSKQYLRPLRRALRDREVQPGIVGSLASIAGFCQRREYKEASEAYMRLAIGNSPWPMGVTMVTFHDRPNRHNIGHDSIAHVLDDETTRKYVQMIKRLISFAESRWPAGPSPLLV